MAEQSLTVIMGGAQRAQTDEDLLPEQSEREAIEERIRQAHAAISEWEAKRDELATLISGGIDMLAKWGINPVAFKAARKYAAMEPAKRASIDASYAICRQALGVPLQQDLPLE